MHKVLEVAVARFLEAEEIKETEQTSRRFEYFCNYCVISQHCSEGFEVDEVTTPDGTESIDGIAVLFDDTLILSDQDAGAFFKALRPRQQISVTYVFVQTKTSESFDSGELLKFGSGVLRLFDGSSAYAATDGTLSELADIHEIVVKNMTRVTGGRPRCALSYVCAGTWNETSGLRKYLEQIQSALSGTSHFSDVIYRPVDREGLIALWNQTTQPVEASFGVQHYVPIPEIPGVAEAYLALVPASDFIHGALEEDGRIRASVFEQNVRAFLGDDNAVNKKIQATLRESEHRRRFALLNNGITIVAPDVRVQSNRISVTGYQIVNGCQTCHVLYRNKDIVSADVLLPVKVIETSDPDILAQVVQATNSQTDIEETQFLSIVPFVQKLGAYFDAFEEGSDAQPRLFFERRIKQYADQDVGRSRLFDIARVARCFAAMFLDLPHLAARYPTQIFREERSRVFQADHIERAYYVAALALYRLELALGNQYVPRIHQTQKWHALMVLRYQVAGADLPPLSSSKKMDAYCDRLLSVLSSGGKASAPPFQKAVDLLDKIGVSGRDRLKSQKSADDIRRVFSLNPLPRKT